MKTGWLHRQLHQATETVESLPVWMRGDSMTTLELAAKSNEQLDGKIRSLQIRREQLQRHMSVLERMDAILSGRDVKRITVVIADAEDPTKDSGFGLKPDEFPDLVGDLKVIFANYRHRAEGNLKKLLEAST
jgi:class 3 adenylate cyclase